MTDTKDRLAEALRADIRRCLNDVATQFRATGCSDSRFVQLIARMDALHGAQRAESGAGVDDKELFIRDASKELKWIAERYDDSKSTGECAADAYDMSCTARRVLADHAQIVLLAAAPENDHGAM